MYASSHLQHQGSPILLLADLLRRFPQLPAATYHIDHVGKPQLSVSIHQTVRTDFEAWRVALGLPVAEVKTWGPDVWLATDGSVADVWVELRGHDTPTNVSAVVELSEAVALLGALPMPTGEVDFRVIEQEHPATAFTHDCGIPLKQRLDCGHCPHEVCPDCERCPHTCRCSSAEDPHDSPLHHSYALGRDLPEVAS